MSNEAALQSSGEQPSRNLPRKFGRYHLFDFIGKGGMAEIYLARAETELGGARLCVVKEILPQYAEHPKFAEMLTFEAKLAARLNHAHIAQVFDLGRADGHLFIAMEYVEGFDLNALLRRCSQNRVALPIEFALRIAADILGALDYAHRCTDDAGKPLGIVHRDVSPSNVLISLDGEVKLCDFGIAHANELVTEAAASASSLQASQTSSAAPIAPERAPVDDAIKGKAGYMSPEHARGETIDARADVFAVGIVLWELLSGRRMYRLDGASPNGRSSLLEQARRADIKPIPEKGLPHEETLRALVAKALAPNKEERFPSAAAMLRALEAYMSDAKMEPSPLKLGQWLVDRFGMATVHQRRARERALTEGPKPSSIPPALSVSPLAASEPPSGIVRSHTARDAYAAQTRTPPEEATDPAPPSLVAAIVDLGPPSNEPNREKLAVPPSPAKRFAIAVIVIAIVTVGWMLLRGT